MNEQQLAGGRTSGSVRVGDTIRRPSNPWTPTVRSVLHHLERAGFSGAPRSLGVDGRGRDVQSALEGETVGDVLPWPDWVWSDSTLVQVGRWLRALHGATSTYVPPADARWFAGPTWKPGLIIGHHDAAPYNAVWRDGELVGFVDWDTAGPSSAELDLAFAALFWVPLHTSDVAHRIGFRDGPDRRRRLHLLLDSYGLTTDRQAFGSIVLRRVRINAETTRRLAAGGNPAYAALLPDADNLDRAAAEIAALPAEFWVVPDNADSRQDGD